MSVFEFLTIYKRFFFLSLSLLTFTIIKYYSCQRQVFLIVGNVTRGLVSGNVLVSTFKLKSFVAERVTKCFCKGILVVNILERVSISRIGIVSRCSVSENLPLRILRFYIVRRLDIRLSLMSHVRATCCFTPKQYCSSNIWPIYLARVARRIHEYQINYRTICYSVHTSVNDVLPIKIKEFSLHRTNIYSQGESEDTGFGTSLEFLGSA